jgi:F0F1-type ATP synthase membrane subunit b/b'
MGTGELLGNVVGAAIVLGVTKKYVLEPIMKRKKKKKKEINYDNIFNY